jgi:hypothetical protein
MAIAAQVILIALFLIAGISLVFMVAYAVIRKARKVRYPIQSVKKWKMNPM